MTKTTDHSPTDKITVLKLLAKGQPLEVAAAAARLTVDQVRDLASHHGYPDQHKMQWAVDVLVQKLDEAAKGSIPPAEHADRPSQDQRPSGQTLRESRNANRVTQNASQPDQATAHTPPPRPAHAVPGLTQPAGKPFDATAALLLRASESDRKRTQQLGERISDMLADLRDRLDAEDQARRDREAKALRRQREKEEREAERAEAQAEVERLQRQLAEAKAKARGGTPNSAKQARADTIKNGQTQHRSPGQLDAATSTLDRARAYQRDLLARHGATLTDVREWAAVNGIDCPAKGSRAPRAVLDAYDKAHPIQEAS